MVIIIIINILFIQNLLIFHFKKFKKIIFIYNFNILRDNDEITLVIINYNKGEKVYLNDT